MENFVAVNDKPGKIVVKHKLFGMQRYCCERIQTMNGSDRLGVIIKGQEIFIYKRHLNDVTFERGMITFADDKLTIAIILR